MPRPKKPPPVSEDMTPDQKEEISEEQARFEAAERQEELDEQSRRQREAQAQASLGQKTVIVNIRVTKFGAGKVSTGEHLPITGDVKAANGQVLEVSRDTAEAMEARGYGEIVE